MTKIYNNACITSFDISYMYTIGLCMCVSMYMYVYNMCMYICICILCCYTNVHCIALIYEEFYIGGSVVKV